MTAQLALAARVRDALAAMNRQPCTICHVDMCNCLLSCGHAFCLMCIQPQLLMNHACPVCIRPCWHATPLFVPQTNLCCLPPAFCADDTWAAALWAGSVCTTAADRLTSLAFWCLTHMHRAQEAADLGGVVFVVNSATHCHKARRELSKQGSELGLWPVESHDSKRGRRAFAAGKCHAVIQRAHIMGGVRVTNVHTVLLLCELSAAEKTALARRLGAAGTSVCLRTCVYSAATSPLAV